ncbi:hypothetical protein GW915_11250 [bacterium]|nr:hypothetical protein [bacterium]
MKRIKKGLFFFLLAGHLSFSTDCEIRLEDLSVNAVSPEGHPASSDEKIAVYNILKGLKGKFPSLPTPTTLKLCTGTKPCSVPGGIVIQPAIDGEIKTAVAVHEIGHQIMIRIFQFEAFRLTNSKVTEDDFEQYIESIQEYSYQETISHNLEEQTSEEQEKLKKLKQGPLKALRELEEKIPGYRPVFNELLTVGGTKRAYEELFADLLAASYESDWNAVALVVEGSSSLRGFPEFRRPITDRGDVSLYGPAAHHLFPEARHAIRVKVGDNINDQEYMDKFLLHLAQSFARDFSWMVKNYKQDYIYMWVRKSLLKTMEDRIIESVVNYGD